jgi:HKD family nuclease
VTMPLLAGGTDLGSVLVGAPPDFDLLSSLRTSTTIRLAIAFGHMSGWELLREAFTRSTAHSVQVLFGQAFCQTEPKVLLEFINLAKRCRGRRFEVRLASDRSIFHPKVWIIEQKEMAAAIVGSGNLSGGGLRDNVECGIYTDNSGQVAALREWFETHWGAAPSFEETYKRYAERRRKVEPFLRQIQKATRPESDELGSTEAEPPSSSSAQRSNLNNLTRPRKEEITGLLEVGRQIEDKRYIHEYRTLLAKTFYFFCARLRQEDAAGFLRSEPDLRNYIIRELKRPALSKTGFNPNRWFSFEWTEWKKGTQREYFNAEYTKVLDRPGDEPPWSYRIKPECMDMVRQIFDDFAN